jgi:antirestriction protein ArdC
MHYTTQSTVSRKDVYQQVTDYVIEALTKGQVPWQQKWSSSGLPKNIITGHVYRGWNVFLLNYVTLVKAYQKPFFLTFKQATALGGHIRRGETGYKITYWALVERKNALPDSQTAEDVPDRPRMRMVPKLHVVFNIEQTEGLTLALPSATEKTPLQKITTCESIVQAMPDQPIILCNGSNPAYFPTLDKITMPYMEDFESEEEYYCTLFHELAHSTGHSKRLNRKELMESKVRGGELYSKEELTAEFTAAYLSAVAGIEQKILDNSAAYIQGWLRKLRNDKTIILRAASQAQAAADYILNTSPKDISASAGVGAAA